MSGRSSLTKRKVINVLDYNINIQIITSAPFSGRPPGVFCGIMFGKMETRPSWEGLPCLHTGQLFENPTVFFGIVPIGAWSTCSLFFLFIFFIRHILTKAKLNSFGNTLAVLKISILGN